MDRVGDAGVASAGWLAEQGEEDSGAGGVDEIDSALFVDVQTTGRGDAGHAGREHLETLLQGRDAARGVGRQSVANPAGWPGRSRCRRDRVRFLDAAFLTATNSAQMCCTTASSGASLSANNRWSVGG